MHSRLCRKQYCFYIPCRSVEYCTHMFLVLRMSWKCVTETSFSWKRRSWRSAPTAGTSARRGWPDAVECFPESTRNGRPKQKLGRCTGVYLHTEALAIFVRKERKQQYQGRSWHTRQGSDTRVIPKNTHRVFLGKNRWKPRTTEIELKSQQKTAPNLYQFQFVMPVTIEDFFMFTAYNDNK